MNGLSEARRMEAEDVCSFLRSVKRPVSVSTSTGRDCVESIVLRPETGRFFAIVAASSLSGGRDEA